MPENRTFNYSRTARLLVTETVEFTVPANVELPEDFADWDGEAQVEWLCGEYRQAVTAEWDSITEDTIDADMWTEEGNA